MQFVSLASGSKGNCYYLASDEGAFLIDCGISLKRLVAGVEAQTPGGMENLGGIFITHEHRDHVAGLGPLLRRYHIPCYGTAATLEALGEGVIGKVDPSLMRPLEGEAMELADFAIGWTRVSHDAADPVSYQILWREKKIGMLTDAGRLSDDNLKALADSDLLLIEANHDREMLRLGPYPVSLKRRIASDHGHLSNETCAQALSGLIGGHTKHVVLAHLSEKNNLPQRAFHTVYDQLHQTPPKAAHFRLWVAQQKLPLALSL